MRSPLEHEPELVAGIGLITVRWAALEQELARLLGSLLKIEPAGDRAYFVIANFSQRIDLIEALVSNSLADGKPKQAALKLIERIKRLWKSRNDLVHSHYVYAQFDHQKNFLGSLAGVGRILGKHPKLRAAERGKFYGPDGVEIPQPKVAHHGFAYEHHKLDGSIEYVPVNRGTFQNHADQLSKRLRQVRLLKKAVQTMAAPLRWGSFSPSSHSNLSPRANRNQLAHQELLERRKAIRSSTGSSEE